MGTAADYLRDCENLLADLEDFASDYAFIRSGGEVHYAVDFSEMHAYVLPEQSAVGMKAFNDDDLIVAQALQLRANAELFRKPEKKPILLSPYLIELEAFIKRQSKQDFVGLAGAAASALGALNELQSTGELAWIEAIAGRGEPSELDAADAERAQRFLEANAFLFAIMGESRESSRQRLKALLSEESFRDLEAVAGDRITVDVAFAAEVQRSFDIARPRSGTASHSERGTNHLDAFAVALVLAGNRELAGRQARLRLVTRSSTMRKVCASFAAAWEGNGGNPVRHPRFFSAFHAVLGERGEDAIAQLEVMRQSLEVFLKSFTAEVYLSPAMQERIAGIKELWRKSLGLSSTLVQEVASGSSSEIGQFFRLVTADGGVRKRIQRRLVEMADEMQRDYQALGLLASAGASSDRREIIRHLTAWENEDSAYLGSSLHYMPYLVEFRSPDVQSALKQSEIAWSDVINLGAGLDFERLLAMAYFLGSWGEWQLAERYCDLALSERDFVGRFSGDETETQCPPTEGYYFKAVCIKKQARTPERLREALELLNTAERLKREVTGQASSDPRYLEEKASVVFLWHEMMRREPDAIRLSSQIPSEGDAVKWSTQVLELLRKVSDAPAQQLQARVHNNLCYYFGEKDTPQHHALAVRHLEQLEELERKLNGPIEKWPPNVLDTIAWVRWKLAHGDVSADERDHLAHWLCLALSAKLLPDERQLISGHLEQIKGRRGRG